MATLTAKLMCAEMRQVTAIYKQYLFDKNEEKFYERIAPYYSHADKLVKKYGFKPNEIFKNFALLAFDKFLAEWPNEEVDLEGNGWAIKYYDILDQFYYSNILIYYIKNIFNCYNFSDYKIYVIYNFDDEDELFIEDKRKEFNNSVTRFIEINKIEKLYIYKNFLN